VTEPIRTVFVEKSVRETAITRRVLDRIGAKVDMRIVDDGREVVRLFATPGPARGAIRRGKRALLLTDFRGEAIKPCPGTPNYLCCGYQILNFGQGCPMDCTYCILQGYFSNPLLTVQANDEAFLSAAAQSLRAEPNRFFRLGTGEFADSLALDPLTGYARRLVEFIRDVPNAVLEIKSKAVHIDDLMGLDHGGRTICAWSMNARGVAEDEEFGAATLEERLEAAARCEAAGYRLAFHFDPIIHHDGWREAYRHTVERIFATVRPESIAWISLGCFRFAPGLEHIIRERFPKSQYVYGEFISGGDGKMRYPQPLRVRIYKKMVEWIRRAGGDDILLYFCMENPHVWQTVMGRTPRDNAELAAWLDAACGWEERA
jgi:spore photoproduct lyase